jgi:transglutaminase-like putative cysteine protease
MVKIKTQLLSFLVIALSFLSAAGSVFAQENTHFKTSLTSTYTTDLVGNTHVEHVFKIKNLTPEYYISKYSLKLNSSKINNVRVINNNQITSPDITQAGGLTEINLDFSDKILGKDKTREFRITYLNPDIAQVNGQVLEAYIPAMNSEDIYDEHRVIVVTPASFGPPMRITPADYDLTQTNTDVTINFEDIQGQGVAAIFGSSQIFNFTIRYHLDNPNNQPAITQVSLPPDTTYQQMNYRQLDPLPEKIEVDEDNNWIASYYLPANETIEVNILADALISLEPINPRLNITPLKEHSNQQTYWESQHDTIQTTANNLSSAQKIYQFVVDTLEYTQADLSGLIERQGAVKALQQPNQAACQEFTDLFIALARANQIPARRATGYAHSNDSRLQPLSLVTDVLHARPEYYNTKQKIWIPIDPTWADTMKNVDYFSQFDLKHVVFAYNGTSSKYPLAAGDYKLPNQQTKDIQVGFKQNWEKIDPAFEASLEPVKFLNFIPIPGRYNFYIENKTGQAWYDNVLKIDSDNEEVILLFEQTSFQILPFQTQQLTLRAYNKQHWLPQVDQLNLTITTQDYENQYQLELKTSKPIAIDFFSQLKNLEFFNQLKQGQLQISAQQLKFNLAIFVGVFVVAIGSLLVFKRRR